MPMNQTGMPRRLIAHVQANDPNRRGPGQGQLDFGPVLRVLARMEAAGYFPGIVAVEPFDYVPDGPGCAARSIGYLRGIVQGGLDHRGPPVVAPEAELEPHDVAELAAVDVNPGHGHLEHVSQSKAVAGAKSGQRVGRAVVAVVVVLQRADVDQPLCRDVDSLGK